MKNDVEKQCKKAAKYLDKVTSTMKGELKQICFWTDDMEDRRTLAAFIGQRLLSEGVSILARTYYHDLPVKKMQEVGFELAKEVEFTIQKFIHKTGD